MDASLVREGAVPAMDIPILGIIAQKRMFYANNIRNWVREWHIDFNSLCDQVFDFTKHGEIVLGLDVIGVRRIQAGDQSTERGDTDTLSNAEHRGIDMSCTGFQGTVCIRNSHTRIIVEMYFNVTTNDTAKRAYKLVHLTWVRTADGIRNTDTVNANLVDGLVDAEEIDEVGAEGILCREADFDTLGLDEVDNLDRGLGDVSHILAMRKFTQEGRCANDNVDAIDTYQLLCERRKN